MNSSKTKTLMLYQLLEKYSDENNPISSTQLIDLLAEKGIKCERKSIYADIKILNEIGYDIVTVKSPKRGFFVAGRSFETPEVRLLIDAVSSAGFITPNKTKTLIEKLENLVSINQAKTLTSQVYCEESSKCDNEEIYYVIDFLNNAIANNKKVKFSYRKRNIDKENKKSFSEKIHIVSPYALIWKDDHYYLICNNNKYDNVINLRLDRIRKITLLDEESRPFSEVSEYTDSFDAADYASKMFNMYSGEVSRVKLKCILDLREDIMDRFGTKVPLVAVDSNHFETEISAAISDGLVSWIMQYGNEIEVVEPKYLQDMVKEKAEKILEIYK